MFSKAMISLFSISFGLLVSASVWADSDHNGHDLVQDVHKAGTRIEFEEDQDEVYDAVQEGYIRPFSEMYEAVENDLHGRIIKVELEEDDDVWVYELKINHQNNIIKVEYNAETLEMLMIKGRNFKDAIKSAN
ncbi:PepSY domain-containing protein [Vibrio cyclitrophicus]